MASGDWTSVLLVLTANCDFAHAKHHGRVTCVPLLTSEFYLQEFHVPKLRKKVSSKQATLLANLLRTSNGPQIGAARLSEWVLEAGVEVVIDTICCETPGLNRDLVSKAILSVKAAETQHHRLTDTAQSLVEAQLVGLEPPSHKKARENVIQPLTQPFRQPPGDALFLSSVGPERNNGYFVFLRHLEQIWESDVSIAGRRHNHSYRRISRLQDLYVHAISQRFAEVFMSIGLPIDYEDNRDAYARQFAESIS